ncbi:hypothetical protein B0I35DRAFT_409535 [Stachybotrys elegans]|uniref:Uncharacterized protein n=1 Tax=Stachybotrys elegans TaxID=80388 RepID=A0A8K0WR05_9HYPO|nr:hypothetical protein B0I35DRAFT_409535 [Stachybotrys elegans]
MAPQNGKANYKSYEAQARMVRAIVAAHPEVKWNYKEICACYGSDMTEHALNHRLRRLRAQCAIVREGRLQGYDMKDLGPIDDLPQKQEDVDKTNIAKYFGESTADGIQFQFRAIKKDADQLRKTEKSGGDVARCLTLGPGSAFSTPSRSAARGGTGSRSTGKRKAMMKVELIEDDDDEDVKVPMDWSDLDDESPSKRSKKAGSVPGQKNGTPSRRAAVKASATIADASSQLQADDSASEVETPSSTRVSGRPPAAAAPSSIFGPVATKSSHDDIGMLRRSNIFNNTATDPYLNPTMFMSDDDGEI